MFGLSWSAPQHPELPLPSGIVRVYIPTVSGSLELLCAVPAGSAANSKTPILFCHGGFGSASVWTEWMSYLSETHSIPCFAVSLRGHGASFYPSYFRMVFMTGIQSLATDLCAAVRYVSGKTGKEVALVGHSSGGGLSQYILSENMLDGRSIKGLALCAGTPCFGQLCVYQNWAWLDPWFMVRMCYHLMHPKSPLSSTALVKGAFFCDAKPDIEIEEFKGRTSNFESFWWPIAMMAKSFIDVRKVLASISTDGYKVLVFAASLDKLMRTDLMRKMAEKYREGYRKLEQEGQINALRERIGKEDGDLLDREDGVVYSIIDSAGHHFQNDVYWEVGAMRLTKWHEQL